MSHKLSIGCEVFLTLSYDSLYLLQIDDCNVEQQYYRSHIIKIFYGNDNDNLVVGSGVMFSSSDFDRYVFDNYKDAKHMMAKKLFIKNSRMTKKRKRFVLSKNI